MREDPPIPELERTTFLNQLVGLNFPFLPFSGGLPVGEKSSKLSEQSEISERDHYVIPLKVFFHTP